MPQATVASHPNCAVGGAQETGNPLLEHGFAEPAFLEAQEVIETIRYPETACLVGRGETDSMYFGQCLQIVRGLHRSIESRFGKAIQPVARADPDVALAVDQ